jgi:hypothetical protein
LPEPPLPKPDNPIADRGSKTKALTCWDKESLFESRIGRTGHYLSPNGRIKAYATVLAAASSALFVAVDSQPVFVMKATDVPSGWSTPANGNSLKIIQWFSDSSKLLLESSRWTHESDSGWGNRPVIYDAKRGAVLQPDVYAALRQRYGTECGFELSTLGFYSSGEIVLSVLPWMDEDGSSDSSCMKNRTKLLYEYESGRLRPYSSGTAPKKSPNHPITKSPQLKNPLT